MEIPHRIAPAPASTPPTTTADTPILSQTVLTPSPENDCTAGGSSHDAMDDNEVWMTPRETLLDTLECPCRDKHKGWWETDDKLRRRIHALEGDQDISGRENRRLRLERDNARLERVEMNKRLVTAIEEKKAAVNEKNAAIDKMNAAINEKNAAIKETTIATKERNIAINEKNAAIDKKNAAIDEKNAAISEKNAAIDEKNAALNERNTAISTRNTLRDRYNTLHFQKLSAEFKSTQLRAKASTLRKERDTAVKKKNAAVNKSNTAIEERNAAVSKSQSQSRERDRLERELAGLRDTLGDRDGELNILRQTRKTLEAEDPRLFEHPGSFDTCTGPLHRRDSQQSQIRSAHDLSAARNTETFDNGRTIRGEGSRRKKTRRRNEGVEN
ncbi:hypothetical protein FB567DRAFT_530069 [Paraphoma chrysanthemicola]|uniref:Uncharacterized protein n=1 Tax=Paraphoma chrysanthemicola TaxID=798071 RepID=A0A8K0R4M9_9PLEO|nr:hypothetical protein FB567DRAFT_530069 [Paraphoma chrysanthemicola]